MDHYIYKKILLQVAEYVLPKFAIDIELKDYGNIGEPTTRVVILVLFIFRIWKLLFYFEFCKAKAHGDE